MPPRASSRSRGDGRQNVQGTLAAEGLDLTPYVSTFRLIAANEREWNRVPIALDGLASFDLDLRLSAARITIASAKLGRTAVAANLRGGRLTVTVGESEAFGGVIKGSLGLAKSAGRCGLQGPAAILRRGPGERPERADRHPADRRQGHDGGCGRCLGRDGAWR